MGAVSAIGKLKAAKTEGQMADIAIQVGQYNRDVFLRRSQTNTLNAQHSHYLAKFTAAQSRFEADVNRRLSDIEHQWASNVIERTAAAGKAAATYTRAQGQAEASILDSQSSMVGAYGTEQRRRMAREGRAIAGSQRSAIAASGATESGSPLEVMATQAEEAELARMDSFLQQTATQRELGYRKELTLAESEFQAAGIDYQTELQVGDMKFRADASKYLADFQSIQTEQQGLIRYQELRMQELNYLSEAYDNQVQGQIALLEGQSSALAHRANASSYRWQAIGDIVSSVVGAGQSIGNMRYAGA